MRRAAAALLALAVGGCLDTAAAPEPVYPSIEETGAKRGAALVAWTECASPLLRKLDDGATDPRAVALGARAGCNAQFRAVAFASLPPGGSISDFFPAMAQTLDAASVKIVMENRAKRRR